MLIQSLSVGLTDFALAHLKALYWNGKGHHDTVGKWSVSFYVMQDGQGNVLLTKLLRQQPYWLQSCNY